MRDSADRSASGRTDDGTLDSRAVDGATGTRAVSPVVGVVLVVAIVVALAGVVAVGFTGYADQLSEPEVDEFDESPGEGGDGNGDGNGDGETETEGEEAEHGLITLSDATADATDVEHTVRFDVEPDGALDGDSLDAIVVAYDEGAVEVSDVDPDDDLVEVGIDEDGDGTIDEADEVDEVDSDSDQLTVEVEGSVDLDGGDTLILRFDGAENGAVGTYAVDVVVNDEDDDERTGEIVIEE